MHVNVFVVKTSIYKRHKRIHFDLILMCRSWC